MVTELLHLQVMMPTQVVLERRVRHVTVDARGGARQFLPRHIDFVATLQTSILTYVDQEGEEGFAAVDGGVLVKKGRELRISTPDAVHSGALDRLESFIQAKTHRSREQERTNRGTMARLEVALVRRMMELKNT